MTHWVVTQKWTVRVVISERRIITEAAPLVRRFIGQPFSNLIHWAEKRGRSLLSLDCCLV